MAEVTVIKSNVDFNKEIDYIANDHRKVKENTVFVGIKGIKRNGNDYILSALQNGATVIVTDCLEECKMAVPYILVKNARQCLATMWSNFYGNPEKQITTIAITGTNGKTSSAYFLYSILREAGINCGLISTIESLINDEMIEIDGGGSVTDISSSMTTPDPEHPHLVHRQYRRKLYRMYCRFHHTYPSFPMFLF